MTEIHQLLTRALKKIKVQNVNLKMQSKKHVYLKIQLKLRFLNKTRIASTPQRPTHYNNIDSRF